jgi:hypothetical protein
MSAYEAGPYTFIQAHERESGLIRGLWTLDIGLWTLDIGHPDETCLISST